MSILDNNIRRKYCSGEYFISGFFSFNSKYSYCVSSEYLDGLTYIAPLQNYNEGVYSLKNISNKFI